MDTSAEQRATTIRSPDIVQNYPSALSIAGGNMAHSSSHSHNGHNGGTSPQVASNAVPSNQSQSQRAYQTGSYHSVPSQSQARPGSIGSTQSPVNGSPGLAPVSQSYPAQRVQAAANSQRRPASPAQVQAAHNIQNMAAHRAQSNTPTQYGGDQSTQSSQSSRTLPHVTQPQSTPSAAAASYQYQTSQAGGFVDPSQVYDPWPEYQRKLEAANAANAARKAEEEAQARVAEEERRRMEAEEAEKLAEQRRREAAEKEKQEAEARAEQERKTREEQERKAREEQEKKTKKPRKKQTKAAATTTAPSATDMTGIPSPTGLSTEEVEIRAMMSKMRELNAKNPSLLAKIWEEERQTHLQSSKSPTPASSKPSAPATTSSSQKSKGKASAPAPAVQQPESHAPPAAKVARSAQPPRANIGAPHATNNPTVAKPSSSTSTLPPNATNMPGPPTGSTRPPAAEPAKKPAQKTIWPPGKKDQLAEAASRWLNSVPSNAAKQISPSVILDYLESNPSYIDLCEKLESIGLALDRAAFAKVLLSAVSDANSAAQRNRAPNMPPATPVLPNSSATLSRQALNPTQPKASIGAPPPVQHFVNGAWHHNAHPSAPGLGQPKIPPVAAPGTPLEDVKMSGSEQPISRESTSKPVPSSKEEAARKRTFGDIVDLTSLSDDEEPLPKRFNHPPNVSAPVANMFKPSSQFVPHQHQHQHQPARPGQPPMSKVKPADETLRTADVVRTLPKRPREALRKSMYDIKTIARDVLLATGKHPEMAHLNAHLDVLKSNFRNVDNNSDLGTFRWDLVDPGEPAPLADADDEDEDSVIGDTDDDVARPRPAPAVATMVGPNGLTTTTEKHASFVGGLKGFMKGPRGKPRHSLPAGQQAAIPGQTPNTSRPAQSQSAGAQPVGYTVFGRPPTKKKDASPSPEAQFTVYKCLWQNCPAELHNLETLKTHVVKSHGEPAPHGWYECLWGDCGRKLPIPDRNGEMKLKHIYLDFEELSEWTEHMKKAHFLGIAWRKGDGPRSVQSGRRVGSLSV
ncbi:hypothetical protein K402DRAFT_390829 [Aulographum hederae CBS 113979]|uniref:C2H2-type domain-containing protein n=1 Tax=Aulographum hederae CBS 113979 TaxID=1176131 RepID=A0A6G1H8B2_9PEZI|nr:hypothetical protein K402DRAFT_390829 [Aulographum hederae CBS 113979]